MTLPTTSSNLDAVIKETLDFIHERLVEAIASADSLLPEKFSNLSPDHANLLVDMNTVRSFMDVAHVFVEEIKDAFYPEEEEEEEDPRDGDDISL